MPKKADFSTFFSTYLAQEVPESDNPNVRLDCPLVDCKNPTQHFYANTDDGTWHCKHCDKSGNARTLITMIHEQYLHTTTQAQYLSLSEVRGLSPQTLEDAGFAYDYKEDRWLVPYYTFNVETGEWSEFLNNLGYFYPSSPNEKGRYTIKKGGTLPLYLYNPGLHQYPPSDTAVICEGEWDTLAYLEAHPDTEDMFLGKPGAGFNVNFMKTLARTKKVKLYLDNDEAGLRQTASAINVIKNEISDINILDWTLIPNAPKDVRDLWMICGTDTASILDDAMVRYDIEHPPEKDITGIYQTSLLDYLHVEDFSTYIEKTASFLYLTDESIMSMAAVLGITSSILIPGEPLWAFLIGPPSCLDGDTIVKINRAGKTFDISLRDLHHMSLGHRKGGKTWNRNIPTRIQRRADNGTIQLIDIQKVVHSGVKTCYEVTTASGHTIKASKDHKFLTQKGWKPLSKLTIKDYLFVNNGNRGIKAKGVKSKNQRYKYYLTYHPYAGQPCQGRRLKSRGRDRVLLHRLVYEAYINDISLSEYINILKYDQVAASQLQYLNASDIIHHIDGNHNNNNLDNLQLTSRQEHGIIHGQENIINVTETTELSRIVSIENIGERVTYDITVANDPHNFIANGIVVHNSGKTTFIDSFGGNNELFDNLSKLSAKSLVSGWKDETGDEPSYLAKLKDKTLFVKDFTVTLTDTADSQREVFGLLTDIYDGTVKIPYGNNQIREFRNLYFNMVAGVTDIVHKHSAASIGERFLRIDYLGKNYESREFGRRALQNFGKSKSQKEVMTANTLGFVNYLRSMPPIMEIEDEYMDPILDLAEFIATIRTKVDSDKEGAQYKPRAELPSRLAVQLGKQFVSTRGVYNVDPNKDEYTAAASAASFEVVKKVAIDTCYGFPLDIVNTIIKNPTASRDVIAKKANIHASKAYRILEELIETDVLTKTNGRVGYQGGRPANYYDVNPKLKAVLHYESKETPKRPRPKRPISRP